MSDIKVEEYIVVSANSAPQLAEEVDKLIKLGWQPYRSAYGVTSHRSGAAIHCQPMFKGNW